MTNFDLYLLKQSKESEKVEAKTNFSFYINAGLDLKKFEGKYTQTLFILAQLYSKIGNTEEGIKYCGLTMKRQL